MKMFKWGLDGGKPNATDIGTQAEWFYKGDGDWVVDPEAHLVWPTYALDGGEEVELFIEYLLKTEANQFIYDCKTKFISIVTNILA